MRVSLEDARSSPVAAAVFVVGVAVAAYALYYWSRGGTFGAPEGSLAWWVGIGAAVVAVAASLARQWL